jgi:hypothetical protein
MERIGHNTRTQSLSIPAPARKDAGFKTKARVQGGPFSWSYGEHIRASAGHASATLCPLCGLHNR